MVYDCVAADPDLRALIERRQSEGRIVFQSTNIEARQLAAIPPERDVGQASIVQTKQIGTAVFILGLSVLGQDCLSDEDSPASVAFEELGKRNPKHTADALIGATAHVRADILVTDDGSFFARFKRLQSTVRIMKTAEFRSFLMEM